VKGFVQLPLKKSKTASRGGSNDVFRQTHLFGGQIARAGEISRDFNDDRFCNAHKFEKNVEIREGSFFI
jgi:hypothetical protein